MGDSRCSFGGSSWFPFEGGGGAWIPSDGSAPCILDDYGGARNPSDGGDSHGLCGKASYDPAAMAPSYGPHRLHPSAARHRSTPYHPPADARSRSIIHPDADLFWRFWMDHYYGQGEGEDWDDGDDDGDDPDREPIKCRICNRESEHITLNCPFMVLTRQLDVLMRTPQEVVSYYYCYMEDDGTNECTDGYGFSYYLPPCQKNVECCAADAMMLHKDGMNLVRVTGLPRDMAEPKLLYELFVKIGPLTNVIVFPDHALAFVNFVSEEAARRAIKQFTGSGLGRLMWATQKPY